MLDTVLGAMWKFFGVPLWQSLAGVAFGVPAALWVERKRQARRTREERKELVPTLIASIDRNLELVDQLAGEFNQHGEMWVPTYALDLTILDATSLRKYELGVATEICERIDRARYELAHLDEKLRLIRQSHASNPQGATNFSRLLGRSCIEHIPTVRDSLQSSREGLAVKGKSSPSDRGQRP